MKCVQPAMVSIHKKDHLITRIANTLTKQRAARKHKYMWKRRRNRRGFNSKSESATEVDVAAIYIVTAKSALVRFMGDGARVLEYTKSIDHKSGGQCVMASFYLTLLSFSSVRTLSQTHLRTISYRLMKGRHVLGNEQLWNGTSCSSNSNTFICTYYLLGSHLIVFFVGNFKQILWLNERKVFFCKK